MNLATPISVLLTRPELRAVLRVGEPNYFAAGVHFIGIGRSFNTTMQAALVSATDGMLLLQGSWENITGGLYYRTARCGSAAIAPTITAILTNLGWDHLITTYEIGKVRQFGIEIPPGGRGPRLRLS